MEFLLGLVILLLMYAIIAGVANFIDFTTDWELFGLRYAVYRKNMLLVVLSIVPVVLVALLLLASCVQLGARIMECLSM